MQLSSICKLWQATAAPTCVLCQAALTDPPPTCLCHQPAGRLHLLPVASICTLTLHLPAYSTSLQPASTCRLWKVALDNPRTTSLRLQALGRLNLQIVEACRPPPPADCGKELYLPSSFSILQAASTFSDEILTSSSNPPPASLLAASNCRLWQASLTDCQSMQVKGQACSLPPPADSGKQLYPDLPPASHYHQPSGNLHLQTVEGSFRLTIHLPNFANSLHPASSCRPGLEALTDPPPTSLFHHLQTVASSWSLTLHLPSFANSLQSLSSCRPGLEALTDPPATSLFHHLQTVARSSCSPPPPADFGKQLQPDPPPTCLCHQPAGHLHLQTVAAALTDHPPTCLCLQPSGCLHLQTLPFPPACRLPPPADSGKQLYPDLPPASHYHQPSGNLHLQTVEGSFRLTIHLPNFANSLQPASSCRPGLEALTDPPPTSLFHHLQTVASSWGLTLHLPSFANSLQSSSSCRPGLEALTDPPPTSLFHHLQTVASSFTLTFPYPDLPATSTSHQAASTCRLWQAAVA
ncbi:hypothetical protein D9C73_008230 [Collichthys lucidus]|uniref:Uncharacterized protein n=1 Tax=Collichthys lucidus TaxID=240159 RepID=A0A4U5UHU4_COLLU|nr:hypothetical protein D9C73_008230 [Collichthys lucidus]